MISLIKPFIKDSLIYGIGEFINRSVQLLVLPLILIFLTPNEFGKLDYFFASRNILSVLFGWGIASSLMRRTTCATHQPRHSSRLSRSLAVWRSVGCSQARQSRTASVISTRSVRSLASQASITRMITRSRRLSRAISCLSARRSR